ncbi:DUF58 domain-containing protein [Halorubrum sp. DTA46]|uniref:DUF58 domain-containing protein n=1 Tax=Halorubrum sp. DTA46 TaxID=3402162 RepID=UPI003AACA825
MATITVTRRGRAVVAVCVFAVVTALAVGTRSLNAVLLPGVVALAAGYYHVARLDDPGVRRIRPADGFVGETREVGLRFHGERLGEPVSPAYPAAVSDRLDDGVVGPTDPVETTIGGSASEGTAPDGADPVSYRVRYVERGEHRLGPVTVAATDVFGLFERRTLVDTVDTVLAYPECRPVPSRFRRGLYAADAVGASREREEFDRLREYARGDPLRDVHWPATAKRDEIVVKEFAASTERGRVSIAGETTNDRTGDDALASATASLAVALLNDGVPVDVTLPAGEVSAEPGRAGRRAVLELAARTGPGPVSVDDPDVRVVADARGARYELSDRTVPFDDLDERSDRTPTETPVGTPRTGTAEVSSG